MPRHSEDRNTARRRWLLLLAVLAGASPCQAFVTTHPPLVPKMATTTSLHGVRSFWKRGLAKVQAPFQRSRQPLEQSTPPEDETTVQRVLQHAATEVRFQTAHPMMAVTSDGEAVAQEPAVPSTSRTATAERRRTFHSDEPLYVLPPETANASLSKLEAEFRDMLGHFANHSMRDLYALKDPRMRTLFQGVAASANERAVYRAFEVLYQDLLPLRMAGRLVYQRLSKLMETSLAEREDQIATVVARTGLDPIEVEEARIVFFEVTSNLNHDTYLTPAQLEATRLFQTVHERLQFETAAAVVSRLDRHGQGKIGLADFLIGLHECAEEQCRIEDDCYPLEVIHVLLEEIDEMENPTASVETFEKFENRRAKEVRYEARYDEMVEIFRGWKGIVPKRKNPNRKWEVVQGCFVGAENQAVVDALRIVFVDYAALRVAAEVILSLAASLLKVKAVPPRPPQQDEG
jgi:hypothetical protein